MSRILFADDEPEQLGLHKMLLEAAGQQVRAALEPAAALAEIEGGWPELLIMDLCLPTASAGLALIRRIRECGSTVPIVVLSGWPEDIYLRAEEKMVARVLVKPVPVAELLEAIGQVAG